jgi:hypothetical protein
MGREREAPAWQPSWGGPIQQWARSFIIKNKWRCDHIHSHEDLLNDAYLIYMKLVEKYPRVIQPAHFMSLFQRALSNHIHDHSRYMQRKRECHIETRLDVSELFLDLPSELPNDGYLNILLSEAPQELSLALAILREQPEALIGPGPTKEPRENLNMKLRRILGIEDSGFDFRAALLKLLRS